MSLINQMLRDLESRRKTDNRQLPSGEGPTALKRRSMPRRPFSLVGVGLILAVVVWAGLELMPTARTALTVPGVPNGAAQEEAPQLSVAAIKPEPRPADQQAEKTPVIAAVEVSAIKVEAQKIVPDARPTVERSLAITTAGDALTSLLNLGVLESATVTRLLLEFEQRPEYEWSFVDQEKTHLKVMLPQVAMRADLVLPAISGPLLKKIGLQQGQDGLQLSVYVADRVELKTLELPSDPFHGQRLLLEFSRPQVLAEENQKIETIVARPVDKGAVADKSKLNRVSRKTPNLTREEQAALAYQGALVKLQNEDSQAAEALLAHALILQPRLLDARLQLIELLQTQQRGNEAESQMLLGLQLHPDNPGLRKGYARRLLAAGSFSEAINTLQAEPRPEVADDLEYHALLAALFQEAGEHQLAITAYRHLLGYRPQESLWWMGLAISLDQSGASVKAKDAYTQAISLPGLRPDLQDYIHNRLQQL